MAAYAFQQELAAFGPAARFPAPNLTAAEAYCQDFARRHYENFSVASRFVPSELRQHFCNIYAYCRWADDLADETTSPAESLQLLAWWEAELAHCYAGQVSHPVFVALRSTIDEFAIPAQPFRDLLVAFRQDQTQTGYETFSDLLEYCRYSANPVGHLVLYLGRCYTPENATLSDSICTGLQLANHWQDVGRDYAKGRVYLPQEDLQRFGLHLDAPKLEVAIDGFQALMRYEVDRAEQYLLAGRPLCDRVAPTLRKQVRLFLEGGLAIIDEIRRAKYDVLARRPKVSLWRKLRLLVGVWMTRGGNG